jgi:hypothetical protein
MYCEHCCVEVVLINSGWLASVGVTTHPILLLELLPEDDEFVTFRMTGEDGGSIGGGAGGRERGDGGARLHDCCTAASVTGSRKV